MATPPPSVPGLTVRGLRVTLPGGEVLIEELSLHVAPGEVIVLVGGSGAGKSTVSRILFERDELERSGFAIEAEALEFAPTELGLVPQRGALFDHLDVHDNIDLALRHAAPDPAAPGPAEWLERVGLDRGLAAAGTPVGALSGGQAQRVAVARALASRRRLLFLDEPSVGLDPHRVRLLARLIREQARSLGVAAVVVTHDVALAAGVADRLYLLDPAKRRVELMFAGAWPGPLEAAPEAERGPWLLKLEAALVAAIANAPTPARRAKVARARARLGGALARAQAPFAAAGSALGRAPRQLVTRPRDFAVVAGRVLRQTLLRPLLFYAVVSTLVGYTVLYVISKVGGAGVRPDALLRQIGGSYVIALAPALSAILFVAASGSATNAWLGAIELTQQRLALEALGVSPRAYLAAPAWLSLGLAYLVVAAVFAAGMIAGGLVVCHHYGMRGGFELLTADLIDPRPERVRYAVRAGFLVWIYAWGMASDVVAKGSARKPDADAVTRAMTGSVVASTLWVVAWELATVLVVLR